jgi:hypothetical protein
MTNSVAVVTGANEALTYVEASRAKGKVVVEIK